MASSKFTTEFNKMVAKHFEPLIESLIEKEVESTFAGKPLMSDLTQLTTQKKEKAVSQFKDLLIDERENIAKAFELLGEFLPTIIENQELEKVKRETLEGGKKILTGEVSLFTQENNGKDSLHEMLGISEETISHFYTVGTLLYEKERLEDAQKVLNIVVFLNPFVSLYWLSNGIALHRLGRIDEAIQAYKLASILDPDNPEPLYYAVSAFIDIHDTYSTQLAYDMLMEVIENNHLQKAWNEQISTLRKRF